MNQCLEGFELFPVGQIARQQQKGCLFITETFFGVNTFDEVVDVDASVEQTARDCFQAPFRKAFIAHNVTDFGQSDQNSGVVFVTQTAFDVIFDEKFVVDVAGALDRFRELVDDVLFFHGPCNNCV